MGERNKIMAIREKCAGLQDACVELQKKYEELQRELCSYGKVAVAFSGGVDSTFLLAAAHEALGDNMFAVTATSLSFPEREKNEAREFCEANHIPQYEVPVNEMEIAGYRENPANRCYLCKRALFQRMAEVAEAHGALVVTEGSNVDDEGDYRPGLTAIRELGIKSPLRASSLTKEEIRILSQKMGLPTWDKPSFACLATRISYGEEITEEKLRMVELGEQLLMDLGFRQMRVRLHGKMARIEVEPKDFSQIMQEEIREKINTEFQKFGFTYVSLDLRGYRTGSMNEALGKETR